MQQAIQLPHFRYPSAISLGAFQAIHTPERRDTLRNPTILSFDGAGHSSARKKRHAKPEARKGKPAGVMEEQAAPLHTTTNRHRRTIETGTSMNGGSRHQIRRGETDIGRGTAYDARLFNKGVRKKSSKGALITASTSSSTEIVIRREHDRKESVRKNVRKTSDLDRAISSNAKPLHRKNAAKKLSLMIKRSPSERAALKNFTLELERHLQVTRELPTRSPLNKAGVSINTIEELLPYKAQVNAAGLAVTSREQHGQGLAPFRSTVPPKKGSARNLIDQSRIPPDTSQVSRKSVPPADHHSTSTGTTVLGFTPPHEPSNNLVRHRRPSTSSDHTIIGFTSPHELQYESLSGEPFKTLRRSLPWLQPREQTSMHSRAIETVENSISARISHKQATSEDLDTTKEECKTSSDVIRRLSCSDNADSDEKPIHRLPESACVPHAIKAQSRANVYRHTITVTSSYSDQDESHDSVQQDDNNHAYGHLENSLPSGNKAANPVVSSSSAHPTTVLPKEDTSSTITFNYPLYSSLPRHACVDRDSLVCQQCYPSRQPSGEISPRQMHSRQTSTLERISNQASEARRGSINLSIRRTIPSRKAVGKRSSASTIGLSSNTFKKRAIITGGVRRLSQSQNVNDKSVFQGLNVATAAACDDDIDAWIEEITGQNVRQFLASLSKFSGLGVSALASVAKRAAQYRQAEMEGWEAVHRERVDANTMTSRGVRPRGGG